MRWDADPTYAEFRLAGRSWLAANTPRHPRPSEPGAARAFDCAWQRAQYDAGWAGVGWPREYGGQGLSLRQQLIWYEELVLARAPGMGSFTVALGHAGPTIIKFGTDAQKAAYLPPILAGETPWCQGFSEPDAGSDLASLRTSAVIDGDELVINGSKTWTSYAELADFQELLVRTDPERPRHKGLSWVVVPMSTPGLTVRPIVTIDGAAEFCECFYDDVRVPLENVVGGLHNGWSVAMYTLSIERGMGFLSARLAVEDEVERLIALAAECELLADPRIAAALAEVRAAAAAVHALGYDGVTDTANPDVVAGVNRVYFGELRQRISRLAVDILGAAGLDESDWTSTYLTTLSRTIASGTREIQKNLLAERVMGLPR